MAAIGWGYAPGAAPFEGVNRFEVMQEWGGRVIRTGEFQAVFAAVSALTAVGYWIWSHINFLNRQLKDTHDSINFLNAQLKDTHDFIDQIGLELGIAGVNGTDTNCANSDTKCKMEKINNLVLSHFDCFGRLSSISRMLDSINYHSKQFWTQAIDKVKESLSLDQVSNQLSLTLKNIEDSGIQIRGVLEKLYNCHQNKVLCENQTDNLKHDVSKLDCRAEKHHDEAITALHRMTEAKNNCTAEKKIDSEKCDQVKVAAQEKCDKDKAVALETCDKNKEIAQKNCDKDKETALEKHNSEIASAKKDRSIYEKKLNDNQDTFNKLNADEARHQAELTSCGKDLNVCEHPGFLRRIFCWL